MPASKKKIKQKLKQKEKKQSSKLNPEIEVEKKIPQNANDFQQTLDSIANQLSSMNSLGEQVNQYDDEDSASVVPSQLAKKRGIQKIQSKKKKEKQKKNLEKALSYQERLDTTVVKDLHSQIMKLPEERQRKHRPVKQSAIKQ
ncbi:hypothetical protein FDP41_003391 [Naegleria fowleri]|uniref:Ribosome biogenesis protein SLX9 n=1 Tax=Naegleria fowleri TaxID=5763 RepID=A0A6A5BWV4_NAEFO|nr:uncharacterized protein FDP41_003391 [Naegleria fowleri]KAF0977399.1 hypothetical protein FDP41_003391 [Naegleria fowleri]CAG4711976.1 unnamed protein product [Naegleria fowleri]